MANFKQIIAMCLEGASYAQITHALGCSRRDVSRAKTVINDEALTLESFRQLLPGWFDERFSDGRSKRTLSFDQPDFQALARNHYAMMTPREWIFFKICTWQVLVLDDFLTTPIDAVTAHQLLNILAEREHRGSTIVTSQFIPDEWYKSIPDTVIAESILNHLVVGAEIIARTCA